MKFQYKLPLFILHLTPFFHHCLTDSANFQTPISCNNETNRPKVQFTTGFNVLIPQDIVFPDTSNGFKKNYFVCSHPNSPVIWDIHYPDPDPNIFDITTNLYWKTNSHYYSSIVIQNFFEYVDNKKFLPLTFTCRLTNHSRNNPCATRSYQYDDNKSILSLEGAKLQNLSIPQIVQNQLNRSVDENECEIILRYRVKAEGNVQYKWESPQGNLLNIKQKPKQTTSPDLFRGLYADIPQFPSCVKPLTVPVCTDCKLAGSKNESVPGLIFHAQTPTMKRPFVAKGVFDVINHIGDKREFHWQWEIPLEKMIKIKAPLYFYVNKTESVTCTISGMFFAVGADLNLQSLRDKNISLFNDSPHRLEILKPNISETKEHGLRELTRPFVFTEQPDPNTSSSSDSIVCSAPLLDFSRVFSKFHNISIITPAGPVILQSHLPKKTTLESGQSHSVVCSAQGRPRPIIKWTFPSEGLNLTVIENVTDWETTSTVLIPDFKETHEGAYKCTVSNYLQTTFTSFQLELPQGLSTKQKVGLGAGLGGVVTLFLLVLGLIYGKILLQRQKYHQETLRVKEEFLQGIPTTDKTAFVSNEAELSNFEPTFESQPFDDSLDIPFINWTIDDEILGHGNFGLVRRGRVKLSSNSEPIEVAVKTLISTENIEDFKRFLYELKLMKCIGFHPNIVSLVASCVERIDERDVLIGVELCSNGSLGEYLQKHAFKLKQFVRDSTMSNYKNTPLSTSTNGYVNLEESEDLTDAHLFIWSLQIATGMEFLANKKVLHGDLAVRNILLTRDNTAKISDFGLSRHLDENSKYKKKSKVGVPWKYLPIESLTARVFSTASDVWAYGVTLWEIFSLGQTPYAGVQMGHDFVNLLQNGMRLLKPTRATTFMYEIMVSCWHQNPLERPSFTKLKTQLHSVVLQLNLQINSHETNQPRQLLSIPVPNPRRTVLDRDSAQQSAYQNQPCRNYSNLPKPGNLYINS